MASSTDYAWIDEIVPGALMVQPAVCTHVLIITEPPVRRGATVFTSTIEVNSKLGIRTSSIQIATDTSNWSSARKHCQMASKSTAPFQIQWR